MDDDSLSLADAICATHGVLCSTRAESSNGELVKEAEELVMTNLHSGRLKATGFPRQADYSANEHLHGEKDALWARIRLDAEMLFGWLREIASRTVEDREADASWTSDQALIWIVTRRLDWVAKASRLHGVDRLHWSVFDLSYTGLREVDGQQARALLLADLQHGRIKARVDEDFISTGWLHDAFWSDRGPGGDMMSMALRRKPEPQLIASSDDERFALHQSSVSQWKPSFASGDIIASYPSLDVGEQKQAYARAKTTVPRLDGGNAVARIELDLRPGGKPLTTTERQIKDAIAFLWPAGIPAIRAGKRNDAIKDRIIAVGGTGPAIRTIERYFAQHGASR